MREFKYNAPRLHNGELRTPILFYRNKPNVGPLPGESKDEEVFRTFGKVDRVWLKDLEMAKANGTLSDVTITIRDPLTEYRPSNLHYIAIDEIDYQNIKYNIKSVQPNLQDRRFIDIVAGVANV
ncbi:phage head-tail adapter protein [Priestia flexa]|uniref:phage head-tail adapter protein n=1 Tax=Priestia flexa TaxID=86664 RepID=UPI001EF4DA70|nr:phage head-tail adapter protein [Priestia flexa]MCG7314142.1 phage head-tail adapter protein [Priestia flexa]MCM3068057.1 phage head-tail adapter protein [Priestia flexa]